MGRASRSLHYSTFYVCLPGEGWLFAFHCRGWVRRLRCYYAFIQVNPEVWKQTDELIAARAPAIGATSGIAQHKIYDLTSFLNEMEKEGRPPCPEITIRKLQDLLAQLHLRRRFKLIASLLGFEDDLFFHGLTLPPFNQ